jgi:parvulin-like peptidyl-prolyl isomerase
VLEEMIRFQAVLAKAKAAGYERDPELRAVWERALVAKFEEDQLGLRGKGLEAATEAELRAAYERDRAQHTVPGRMRAGVILLRSALRAGSEEKQALVRKAEALRAEAVRLDAAGFAELARRHSEDQATRYQGGDAGWLTAGAGHWEAEVMGAIAALGTPGEVGPVVVTPKGCYVARLIESQAAEVLPFERVREGIQAQLVRRKLKERRATFYDEIRAGLEVEINQANLERVANAAAAAERDPPSLPGGEWAGPGPRHRNASESENPP